MTDDARIRLYLHDLVELGRRHGVTLTFNDGTFGFAVEVDPPANTRSDHEAWLLDARKLDSDARLPSLSAGRCHDSFVVTGKSTITGDIGV